MLLPRPITALLTAAVVVAGLVGCSGSTPSEPPDPGPWGWPGQGDDETPDELDDPQDRRLVWNIGAAPAGWEKLPTDAEDIQFAISGTHCVITFFSRTDINRSSYADEDEVFDEFVAIMGQMIGTHLTSEAISPELIPAITDDHQQTRLQFDGVRLAGHPGIDGELYVYLSGVNSLALSLMCGQDQFEQYRASDFEPFLAQSVRVDLTL